jgi:hypothetical protein
MKFLLVLTTMAALIVQPLFAQGKNKPAPKKPVAAAEAPKAAPVATAPAPAAPAQEVPTAATAPQSSDSGLKFSALAWGGYNIASSDEFSKAGSSTDLTKGGIAGGVELLGGISLIRGGVVVSYLPVASYSFTGISGSANKAFLPIEAVVNVYFLGFYAGGRGGYLLDIGSSSISGVTYTKTNGTIFGGQVGYQYTLGSVAIDIGVIATFAHAEAEGTGGSAGAHADYTNIVPRIGIQYTF